MSALLLHVNGIERSFDNVATVADLLVALGLQAQGPAPAGVAVAIDAEVVPRSRFDEVRLQPGQKVEILRAVGGG